MGTKINPGNFDCHSAALFDEPLFTLLARDPAAPDVVEEWANRRERRIEEGAKPEADRAMVSEARQCASEMRKWREVNFPERWARRSVGAIEIEELREAGEDGGGLMGFFCRGHVDPHAFADAANHYSGAATCDDRRHVTATMVKHVHWRTVPMAGEPAGTMRFVPAVPGPGAWAATVAEPVIEYSHKRWRERDREYQRGRLTGIAEGINWALRWLDGGSWPAVGRYADVAKEMQEAFTAARDKIEKERAA